MVLREVELVLGNVARGPRFLCLLPYVHDYVLCLADPQGNFANLETLEERGYAEIDMNRSAENYTFCWSAKSVIDLIGPSIVHGLYFVRDGIQFAI